MSVTKTETWVISCDGPRCSRVVSSTSRLVALGDVDAAGWKRDGKYNYCPSCRLSPSVAS